MRFAGGNGHRPRRAGFVRKRHVDRALTGVGGDDGAGRSPAGERTGRPQVVMSRLARATLSEVVAWRMFQRWTLENFFRYMRQRVALDAPVNYAVEPAEVDLRVARASVVELEQAYGQQARANPEALRPAMGGFKIAQADLTRQLRAAEAQCQQLEQTPAACPRRVPLKTLPEDDIVRLAPEAKHLTDTIKMLAFRAETARVRGLTLNAVRTEADGRALVREMLLSSADIVPLPAQQRLLVRVHSRAKPRHNKALTKRCETLNALEVCYPGTQPTPVYETPEVA